MSAYSPAPAPPVRPPSEGVPVSVNLTDTVSVWWYVAAVFLPIVGFIAGIVFMARSKIGPAIALWATCFIAATFWAGIYAAIEYDRLTGDEQVTLEDYVAPAAEDETSSAGGTSTDWDAYSDCLDAAQTPDEIAAC